MYNFPENLYTDVRIDNYSETKIQYSNESLSEIKEKTFEGVFLRMFDGTQWHYSSFTGKHNIQQEIDRLANESKPNPLVYQHPIIAKLEANEYYNLRYSENGFYRIPLNEKVSLAESFPNKYIAQCTLLADLSLHLLLMHNLREFYSSKGASLYYDDETFSLVAVGTFLSGDNTLVETYEKCGHDLSELNETVDAEITRRIKLAEEFVKDCVPVKPGTYPVILSNEATALLCHESVGHKSEADFSVGCSGMQEFWKCGDELCANDLSIIDNGAREDTIRIPYDDEGTKTKATYVINHGKVGDLLSDATSAAAMGIETTGNARAIDYLWEPMVRMTTIYMTPGNLTEDELLKSVDYGIYVENYIAGGGLDVFSIAPGRSYMIENGKISKPVAISLISARCIDALSGIEGRTKEIIFGASHYIKCGKPPQLGLPTAGGGPITKFHSFKVV